MLVYHDEHGICEVVKEFQSDNIKYYVIKMNKNHFYTGTPVDEVEEI